MSHNDNSDAPAFVQGQTNISEKDESTHQVDIQEHEASEAYQKQDFESHHQHPDPSLEENSLPTIQDNPNKEDPPKHDVLDNLTNQENVTKEENKTNTNSKIINDTIVDRTSEIGHDNALALGAFAYSKMQTESKEAQIMEEKQQPKIVSPNLDEAKEQKEEPMIVTEEQKLVQDEQHMQTTNKNIISEERNLNQQSLQNETVNVDQRVKGPDAEIEKASESKNQEQHEEEKIQNKESYKQQNEAPIKENLDEGKSNLEIIVIPEYKAVEDKNVLDAKTELEAPVETENSNPDQAYEDTPKEAQDNKQITQFESKPQEVLEGTILKPQKVVEGTFRSETKTSQTNQPIQEPLGYQIDVRSNQIIKPIENNEETSFKSEQIGEKIETIDIDESDLAGRKNSNEKIQTEWKKPGDISQNDKSSKLELAVNASKDQILKENIIIPKNPDVKETEYLEGERSIELKGPTRNETCNNNLNTNDLVSKSKDQSRVSVNSQNKQKISEISSSSQKEIQFSERNDSNLLKESLDSSKKSDLVPETELESIKEGAVSIKKTQDIRIEENLRAKIPQNQITRDLPASSSNNPILEQQLGNKQAQESEKKKKRLELDDPSAHNMRDPGASTQKEIHGASKLFSKSPIKISEQKLSLNLQQLSPKNFNPKNSPKGLRSELEGPIESFNPTNQDIDMLSLGTEPFFNSTSDDGGQLNLAKLSFYERLSYKVKSSERNLEKLRQEKRLQDQQNEAKELTFHPRTNDHYLTLNGLKEVPKNRDVDEMITGLASPKSYYIKPHKDDPNFVELKEKPEINELSHQLSEKYIRATSPDVFERLLWDEGQANPVEVKNKLPEDVYTFKPVLNKNTEEIASRKKKAEDFLSASQQSVSRETNSPKTASPSPKADGVRRITGPKNQSSTKSAKSPRFIFPETLPNKPALKAVQDDDLYTQEEYLGMLLEVKGKLGNNQSLKPDVKTTLTVDDRIQKMHENKDNLQSKLKKSMSKEAFSNTQAKQAKAKDFTSQDKLGVRNNLESPNKSNKKKNSNFEVSQGHDSAERPKIEKENTATKNEATDFGKNSDSLRKNERSSRLKKQEKGQGTIKQMKKQSKSKSTSLEQPKSSLPIENKEENSLNLSEYKRVKAKLENDENAKIASRKKGNFGEASKKSERIQKFPGKREKIDNVPSKKDITNSVSLKQDKNELLSTPKKDDIYKNLFTSSSNGSKNKKKSNSKGKKNSKKTPKAKKKSNQEIDFELSGSEVDSGAQKSPAQERGRDSPLGKHRNSLYKIGSRSRSRPITETSGMDSLSELDDEEFMPINEEDNDVQQYSNSPNLHQHRLDGRRTAQPEIRQAIFENPDSESQSDSRTRNLSSSPEDSNRHISEEKRKGSEEKEGKRKSPEEPKKKSPEQFFQKSRIKQGALSGNKVQKSQTRERFDKAKNEASLDKVSHEKKGNDKEEEDFIAENLINASSKKSHKDNEEGGIHGSRGKREEQAFKKDLNNPKKIEEAPVQEEYEEMVFEPSKNVRNFETGTVECAQNREQTEEKPKSSHQKMRNLLSNNSENSAHDEDSKKISSLSNFTDKDSRGSRIEHSGDHGIHSHLPKGKERIEVSYELSSERVHEPKNNRWEIPKNAQPYNLNELNYLHLLKKEQEPFKQCSAPNSQNQSKSSIQGLNEQMGDDETDTRKAMLTHHDKLKTPSQTSVKMEKGNKELEKSQNNSRTSFQILQEQLNQSKGRIDSTDNEEKLVRSIHLDQKINQNSNADGISVTGNQPKSSRQMMVENFGFATHSRAKEADEDTKKQGKSNITSENKPLKVEQFGGISTSSESNTVPSNLQQPPASTDAFPKSSKDILKRATVGASVLRDAHERLSEQQVRDPYRNSGLDTLTSDIHNKPAGSGQPDTNILHHQQTESKGILPFSKNPEVLKNSLTDQQSNKMIKPKSSLQLLQDQLSRANKPNISQDNVDRLTVINKHPQSRESHNSEEEKLAKEQLSSSQTSESESEDTIISRNENVGKKSDPFGQKLGFQLQARNSIFLKSVGNSEETASLLKDESTASNPRFSVRKTLTPEQVLRREQKKKKMGLSKVEEGAICWDPTLKVEKALQGATAMKFMEYGTLPAGELHQIKYFNESMRRISQAETLKNIALKAKQKYDQMQTKPSIIEEKD